MSKHQISVTVNGDTYENEVDARLLLSDYLRHEIGLPGTHVGCEHGACGVCTILVDGVATRSCLSFAVQVDGLALETVEGLGSVDQLHPIQQAFWEKHGLQCGFCTPGMMMSAVELLRANLNPTKEEICESIGGNICRCTGYQNIVSSIERAAEIMRENALNERAVA